MRRMRRKMTKTLQGRTILITRSRDQAPHFRRLLKEAGARVLEVPTLRIHPRLGPELDQEICQVSRYDWLIFTSANGAEVFLKRTRQLESSPDAPSRDQFPRISVIGPATKDKVQQYGYEADLVPELYQAEGIVEDLLHFHQGRLEGLKVLLPRASRARSFLPEQLCRHGAEVRVLALYDTLIPEESRQALRQALGESPDLITLTSSSTVLHLLALSRPEQLRSFRYAAIGPITAATANEQGLDVVLQASHYTIPGLVKAIEDYFSEVKEFPPQRH